MRSSLPKWGLPALTLVTFFFLLGTRSLNEPDEGRYSEIAREMIETGDWLVPHLWYLPHLDKPPMTCWLVAASMKWFGHNEWAVRLPAALAGISGVWAAFLLGSSLGGQRVGFWSALILQSSLLYFAMSRILTPDIFLTQFVAWAMYFFWRSWLTLNPESRIPNPQFLLWHLSGWAAIALGFLAKGPIALAIPLAALAALMIYRRRQLPRKRLLFIGLLAGLVLFFVLAVPWFLVVFHRVPQSAHYMILGQVAGHLLGTTIKNRSGGPFYFFGILAFGLLPWTILLGWLWRRAHWRMLTARQKDGWLLLNVWAVFPFALFTLSRSKLPAYILPIFPALALALALRFFCEERDDATAPRWPWRLCLVCSLLLPAIFPLLTKFVFKDPLPDWLAWQTPIFGLVAVLIFRRAREWKPSVCAAGATALALVSLAVTVAEIPMFETGLRDNQTLKPLGAALRENYRPGDALVCWGQLPQGLPFYAGSVISATNRPYLGGMDLTQVPFAFPGNRERLGNLLLPDENALAGLLRGGRQVWVVGYGNKMEHFEQEEKISLRLVTRAGRWELFSNQ